MNATSNILKRFFVRLGFFFIPFLIFILLYACLDPFCIIHKQDHPYNLHWDRDVQSSRLFLSNYPKYKYSSFIMGNSECMAFKSKEWGKYINDTIPFHFDASSESILDIYQKLKYLDKMGIPIKNVLLITDPTVFRGTNTEGQFSYMHDYKINGTSPLYFHYIFFKGFISHFFFVSYIDYSLNHVYRPYMHGVIPSDMEQYIYDSITNDWILQNRINSIHSDSVKFYSNQYVFKKRTGVPAPFEACIDNYCESVLLNIKKIFASHNTNYKIVLGPTYLQRATNPADIDKLKKIFGDKNVFNFSGITEYSKSIGNYYDNVHYKPFIGAQLLKIIYNKDTAQLIH